MRLLEQGLTLSLFVWTLQSLDLLLARATDAVDRSPHGTDPTY
jgi:hypothetical protein